MPAVSSQSSVTPVNEHDIAASPVPSESTSASPALTTLANEPNGVVEEGTTVAPVSGQHEGDVADMVTENLIKDPQPTTLLPQDVPIEENEISVSEVVTAKISVLPGTEPPPAVNGTDLPMVDETYPTTKTWLPDTSLAAEHKEVDDLLIGTEIPAIVADALDSIVNDENDLSAGISRNTSTALVTDIPQQPTTASAQDANEIVTTVVESQTTPPVVTAVPVAAETDNIINVVL